VTVVGDAVREVAVVVEFFKYIDGIERSSSGTRAVSFLRRRVAYWALAEMSG